MSGNRHWQSWEDDFIRRLAPTRTAADIGAAMSRSKKAVQCRAERMGIQLAGLPHNAVGRFGEGFAMAFLEGASWVSALEYQSPYDIAWNGLRIDVKTSSLRVKNRSRCWAFDLSSGDAEWLLCFGLGDRHAVQAAWLIPRSAVEGRRCIAIGVHRSKYDSFRLELPEDVAA